MEKYVAQSGREYLLNGDIAEPCFNGANFTVHYGTVEDLEKFDQRLRWDSLSGQYS